MKTPDCPSCGETLHAMGDEEREARHAYHADYVCHNRDCDACGEPITQNQIDNANDRACELRDERRQENPTGFAFYSLPLELAPSLVDRADLERIRRREIL